ncbi:TetR/AcrR family transcriptional regulator [Azospirillum sp. B4]|uniref:TetR/AcrR family transcriptional regulator n=1 Tax=Azospirillum sp. B4 TaxID=95605 RepID=UPI0005CAFC0D|nr:TetR/AcrR family transcriptional regulator [Azospirillum sp. B4]
MRQKSNSTSTRRPRADGERNRARLIAAAKAAFAERGATASLEGIASEANVSIASLYRHFPTRDALIEAVYRQETDTLIDAAVKLMDQREPKTALREWLLLFVEFLDTKHGMAEALNTLIGGPDALYSGTPGRLAPPVTALVDRAVKTGGYRIDVEPIDLLRAISGVANHTANAEWKQSAIRMVDLLLKGLQAKE